MKKFMLFFCVCLFFSLLPVYGQSRGSIPDVLLRPNRGEASRYPVDFVIGELGQGRASSAAYNYANSISAGLLSGQMNNPDLASINPVLRESYLKSIGNIDARSFRIGGGRVEPDGAVSFLVRFIGREYGITGELFINFAASQDEGETGNWIFDELLLEEAIAHNDVQQEVLSRMDMLPYERFF